MCIRDRVVAILFAQLEVFFDAGVLLAGRFVVTKFEHDVASLHFAARFSFGKILHDIRINLIQLVQQQDDDGDRPDQDRAPLEDGGDHGLGRLRLYRAAGGRAEEARALEQGGHDNAGDAGADLEACLLYTSIRHDEHDPDLVLYGLCRHPGGYRRPCHAALACI